MVRREIGLLRLVNTALEPQLVGNVVPGQTHRTHLLLLLRVM